jgi:hypothetical protein
MNAPAAAGWRKIVQAQPLGRVAAPDGRHVRLYGLTTETMPTKPTPVVLGINWYQQFDAPVARDGAWWIGVGDWKAIRGGHAICVKPPVLKDYAAFWTHYDQGVEGACVGFSASRMMSLLNASPTLKPLYDGKSLYLEAREIDGIEDTMGEGTTVRAGMDVLRAQGPFPVRKGIVMPPEIGHGIVANRWATSVEQIVACLGQDASRGWVDLVNSWGRRYPRVVRLPLESLERLLREDGDATIVTDR